MSGLWRLGNSPINVINSKYPQQQVLNIILYINHCAVISKLPELLDDSNYQELNRKILAGFN